MAFRSNSLCSRNSGEQNENAPAASSGGFLPARKVLERYQISQMTLWRWLHDEALGFPKPIYLNRYRYWRLEDIEAWEAAQSGRAA